MATYWTIPGWVSVLGGCRQEHNGDTDLNPDLTHWPPLPRTGLPPTFLTSTTHPLLALISRSSWEPYEIT